MDQLLQLEAQIPFTQPISWPMCPTPIRVNSLIPYLNNHPDQRFAHYIINGLSVGFRIGFSRQANLKSAGCNHPSSLANPIVVADRIRSELSAGRLVGPILPFYLPHLQVSPIGLVPKSHSQTQWRMIVDLSSPTNRSVNDGISEEWCSLKYVSLDDAVHLIRQLGPGTMLLKMDIKDAYRIIPVHPEDHHLLAISWEEKTYIDRALPFGLRSAPLIFTAVADAISWAIHCRGIRFFIHYLDDFLFFGTAGTLEAAQAAHTAASIFNELGIPVAEKKTEGPATSLTFLGILIDTVAMQLRIPEAKLGRLQELTTHWMAKKACTRRELESLLGHLSHAATVIHPGRVFLRSLFSLLPLAKKPNHFVRLNRVARADLQWWSCFLQSWNGVSILVQADPPVNIFSDASGSFGCGAFDPSSHWFQLLWPSAWSAASIAAKELVPVVAASATCMG